MMLLFFQCLIYLRLIICSRNVNQESTKVLYSCAFVTFSLFEHHSKVESKDCEVSTIDGESHADCSLISNSSNPLNTVPNNLDPNIQHLDLFNNFIKLFNEESFKRYKNLISLSLRSVTVRESVADTFVFRPLESLKVLNLSKFHSPSKLNYYWPPSLTVLNVSMNFDQKIPILDVSHLINLEILDISSNEFEDIPLMSQLAPIKYAHFQLNPFGALTVENLAKYCNIQNMEVALTGNSGLRNVQKYCVCVLMFKWLNTYYSKHEVFCFSHIEPPVCNATFSKTAIQNRENCLKAMASSNVLLIIGIVVGSVVLLVLLTGFFIYKYGVLEKKVESGELEKDEKPDKASKNAERADDEDDTEEEENNS